MKQREREEGREGESSMDDEDCLRFGSTHRDSVNQLGLDEAQRSQSCFDMLLLLETGRSFFIRKDAQKEEEQG